MAEENRAIFLADETTGAIADTITIATGSTTMYSRDILESSDSTTERVLFVNCADDTENRQVQKRRTQWRPATRRIRPIHFTKNHSPAMNGREHTGGLTMKKILFLLLLPMIVLGQWGGWNSKNVSTSTPTIPGIGDSVTFQDDTTRANTFVSGKYLRIISDSLTADSIEFTWKWYDEDNATWQTGASVSQARNLYSYFGGWVDDNVKALLIGSKSTIVHGDSIFIWPDSTANGISYSVNGLPDSVLWNADSSFGTFDTDHYMRANNTALLDPGSGSFTINLYCRTYETTDGRIVEKDNGTSYWLVTFSGAADYPTLSLKDNDGHTLNAAAASPNFDANDTTWHYYSFVYDVAAHNVYIYIDESYTKTVDASAISGTISGTDFPELGDISAGKADLYLFRYSNVARTRAEHLLEYEEITSTNPPFAVTGFGRMVGDTVLYAFKYSDTKDMRFLLQNDPISAQSTNHQFTLNGLYLFSNLDNDVSGDFSSSGTLFEDFFTDIIGPYSQWIDDSTDAYWIGGYHEHEVFVDGSGDPLPTATCDSVSILFDGVKPTENTVTRVNDLQIEVWNTIYDYSTILDLGVANGDTALREYYKLNIAQNTINIEYMAICDVAELNVITYYGQQMQNNDRYLGTIHYWNGDAEVRESQTSSVSGVDNNNVYGWDIIGTDNTNLVAAMIDTSYYDGDFLRADSATYNRFFVSGQKTYSQLLRRGYNDPGALAQDDTLRWKGRWFFFLRDKTCLVGMT